MFIKLLLFSIVIVAIVMLAFGIKMIFDKKAQFTAGSCSGNLDADGTSSCGCSTLEKDKCQNQ